VADCGVAGGASLKVCKSCMLVRYCNAACQANHWPTHKPACKQRAAELRLRDDEALFKVPPAKEDCPICCFLTMQKKMIFCYSLPDATVSSVPIYDFVWTHIIHVAEKSFAEVDEKRHSRNYISYE